MPTLYSNPLFPGIGDNGGPPIEEPYNPLPPLGSRALTAAESLPQERGTYGQLRSQIVRLGGGEPAARELSFTGIDQRFRPDDPVTRQELVDYLRETTPMFSAVEDRATGTLGAPAEADWDVRLQARENLEQGPVGQNMFDRARMLADEYLSERAAEDPDFIYDDDEVFEMGRELFEEDLSNYMDGLGDEEIFQLAGMESPFDPGATRYSEYFTPGMTDYRERRYSFTDPGRINPTGIRNYSGAGAHFQGDENAGFLHTRVATANVMGGEGNAYHLGEIQSDIGQSLRAEGPDFRPVANPDLEALFELAESGTGLSIPEELWTRLQDPEFARNTSLPVNFFEKNLVLNQSQGIPSAESFTTAIEASRSAALNQLRNGADRVRTMRDDLDVEAREAMNILAEGLEVEGSYLGYDTVGSAMSDINQSIRNAFRLGEDPVNFVAQVYDIDPTRSERERFLLDQIAQYASHSYMSPSRQTRKGLANDLSSSLARRMSGGRTDETEMEAVIRSAFDVDIPPQYTSRINRGERISDDELEVIANDFGPVIAAGIAGQQELMLANIQPNALRYLSGVNRTMREGTRSPMPLVESTNQWVDYALKNELANAAREGREYFTISNPEMVRRMTYGQEEGQGAFYGEIVPQRLLNILRKLDRDVSSTMDPMEFQNNQNVIFGPGYMDTPYGQQTVFTVRLTPDLRARILGDEQRGYRGLTTFLRPETIFLGGALAGAAMQEPQPQPEE
jgi:hypothetical protein